MTDLLITNAYIYADRGREIPSGWLSVRGRRIDRLGSSTDELPEIDTETTVINAQGKLVTPGLVNTHHHMYQNLTRAFAPAVNANLFNWLTTLYPVWANIDAESVYLSTRVAMAELLLGGCTLSSDHMYVHPRPQLIDAQIRAAHDQGFRFYANRGSMTRSVEDGGLPPVSVVQDLDTILADSERVVGAFHDARPGAMTRVALAPCSPFSVTEDVMIASAELAEKHDLRLHSHLAEDTDENDYCAEVYGCTPVEYFERVGWITDRAWVAHFIYPSEEEQQRCADAGVGVAHCPSSNMILAGGAADIRHLRRLGTPVGLGCDGNSSGDHSSLWLESRTALLLNRFMHGPTAMSSREILDTATRGGARCLGWDDECGHLNEGACADLVIWDSPEEALAGALSDPIEAWLRCGPRKADTTVVNGKPLVREGQVLTDDHREVLTAHRDTASALQGLA